MCINKYEPFIDFGTHVSANGAIIKQPEYKYSLDEIFGSLSKNIQANDALQLIRCYPIQMIHYFTNEIEETKNEITVSIYDCIDNLF